MLTNSDGQSIIVELPRRHMREEHVVVHEIDPEAVVARIRRAVEESPYHSRKLRCYTLMSEFGIHKRTEARIHRLQEVFHSYGVTVFPPLLTAPLHEWVHLGLAEDHPEVPPRSVDPRPPQAWFDHMAGARLTTEREVEARFVSPLFHALGYDDEQETIGLPITIWEGVHAKRAEVDVAYFRDGDRAEESRVALVVVECKSPAENLDSAIGQARSYCEWVKPVYFAVTNGTEFRAFAYRPGPIPNAAVVAATRADLAAAIDDLFRFLSPAAALATRERLRRATQ